MKHKIIYGDCIEEMKKLPENSVDACVTDPPFELNFMNKGWDRSGIAFHTEMWQELYRVLKPGAHILVAGIARTHHRMWVALEDAGFEIRDGIYHIFGSGFPKSTDISKQIDKLKCADRKVIGKGTSGKKDTHTSSLNMSQTKDNTFGGVYELTEPTTLEAKQYEGFGTALKPAVEIWCLARKPISERNIAANVLKWGVGGINVDGCRILMSNEDKEGSYRQASEKQRDGFLKTQKPEYKPQGRFPANLILECCCGEDELMEGKAYSTHRNWKRDYKDESPSAFSLGVKKGDREVGYKGDCIIHANPNCVCRMLDEQSKNSKPTKPHPVNSNVDSYEGWDSITQKKGEIIHYPENTSSASRFFYQAKASQKERWFYCMICKQAYPMKERDKHIHNAPENEKYKYLEFHPTQKPEDLIGYLMRLVTPPNGTTIDPFLGSGTAIIAAEREGFNCVGIDSSPIYCDIAFKRAKEKIIQQKISGVQSTIEKTGF